MSTNRDLDQAIDRVAKGLTHVDDDPQFASRIVASLPERATWFGWLTHSWTPRLAMIAIVAVVASLWNERRPTETPLLTSRPVAGVVGVLSPTIASVNPERLVPVSTNPLEPLEHLEPLEPVAVDFERSLTPVASPGAIAVASLTTRDLPAEDALVLPSLVIPDLPLTADSFSPRD